MSLKFNKDFIRGLFTLDESNKLLFISPICYAIAIIAIYFCLNEFVFVADENSALLSKTSFLVLTGFSSIFIANSTNLYLYQNLLKYDPFKGQDKENEKVMNVFTISGFFASAFFFIMIGFIGVLTMESSPRVSMEIGLTMLSLTFVTVLSFFKFHVLDVIESSKKSSPTQTEILATNE